jgi:hypothetical protein
MQSTPLSVPIFGLQAATFGKGIHSDKIFFGTGLPDIAIYELDYAR